MFTNRCLALFMFLCLSVPASGLNYDIVYIRAPRLGDDVVTRIPEVKDPIRMEPGTDLVLLRADGSEEVLVEGGIGAVFDPCVSFDGEWVYYSKVHDQTRLNKQRRHTAYSGADIFKIHVPTRKVVQLTFQEFTPSTGIGLWKDDPTDAGQDGGFSPGHGVYNTGPCPLSGGRIVFTSSRNGYLPNKGFTYPNLQLYVMDEDGRNVEQIGYLNLGSALHPYQLMDGRIIFSSYESQGLRDQRIWAIWSILPDGTHWDTVVSGFKSGTAFHFHTETTDGSIMVTGYYNQNNNGFGSIYRIDGYAAPGEPRFESPIPNENPEYRSGWFGSKPRMGRLVFTPKGWENVTAFSHLRDNRAAILPWTGDYAGKVTHPAAGPDNDLLLTYTPGQANHRGSWNTPVYDTGIYVLPASMTTEDPDDLVEIKNDPLYNEQQPRALLPYSAIYGIEEPVVRVTSNWQNDNTAWLQELAVPFGLIGASSLYHRESAPGIPDRSWRVQGADAGEYDNSEIWGLRIVSIEPTPAITYGRGGWSGISSSKRDYLTQGLERLRILGEVPVRKPGVTDALGDPDTSFIVALPADTPFTFQTINEYGQTLNSAQTWHQLRPGEVRVDCGGCHAHSRPPLEFDPEKAAQAPLAYAYLGGFTPVVLDGQLAASRDSVMDVEFERDIAPLLDRECLECHSGVNPTGLNLADTTPQYTDYPQRFYNVLDHVDPFKSRLSPLAWKVWGRRMDGTEETGWDSCPTGLSWHERATFNRWIDLGAAISKLPPEHPRSYFADHTKPTVVVRPSLYGFRLGLEDLSKVKASSLYVALSHAYGDIPAGENVWPVMNRHRWGTWSLTYPRELWGVPVEISVHTEDGAGNVKDLVVSP